MSELYNLRKHALECARLASDCKQLARDVESQELKAHYLRMAEEWSALANGGQILACAWTSKQEATLDGAHAADRIAFQSVTIRKH